MARAIATARGSKTRPRRRLSRDGRHRQLLDVVWQLIREEGTEALTLGRVAEEAGVTKPVVYDHFGTRIHVLAHFVIAEHPSALVRFHGSRVPEAVLYEA